MKLIIRLGAIVLGAAVLGGTGAVQAGEGILGRVIRNRNAPNLVIGSDGKAFLVWRNGVRTAVQMKDGKLTTQEPAKAVKAKNGQVLEVCPNCK